MDMEHRGLIVAVAAGLICVSTSSPGVPEIDVNRPDQRPAELAATGEDEAAAINDAARGDGPQAVTNALLSAVETRGALRQANATVVLLETPGEIEYWNAS